MGEDVGVEKEAGGCLQVEPVSAGLHLSMAFGTRHLQLCARM